MASFSFTAFKWTGTYYNAQYTDSYDVTFEDNDAAYQGGGDADETVSVGGGTYSTTQSQPYSIDVSFTDTSGAPHVETFYFFNAGGEWYFIPGPDSEFTEGATLGSYQSHTNGWNYADAACFTCGTRIATKAGARPIETLVPGDLIWTAPGAFKPLRHVLSRALTPLHLVANPKLAPVRIAPGALGPGLPDAPLWVSRQHRMLVSSRIARRMFGAADVLVAAIRLTELPGISVDPARRQFSYYHLVFDGHEVVRANGALSESFHPAAAAALAPEMLAEHGALFGTVPAALIPPNRRQKRLVARHLKSGQALAS